MLEISLALNYPYQHKPRLLVDVGAHVGGFASHFVSAGWKAICIEPEQNNWNELAAKYGTSPRVQLHKVAVGEKRDKVPFYTSSEHWGIHSMQPWHETHKQSGLVDVTLLAYIVHEPVSLLRLNIEGSELPALKGYNMKLWAPEMALVEFYDSRTTKHFGYDHHDIVSYMQHFGYIAWVSEWAEVEEYSRKGEKTIPHKHIGIGKYPLDHAPAWGNLIFVKDERWIPK